MGIIKKSILVSSLGCGSIAFALRILHVSSKGFHFFANSDFTMFFKAFPRYLFIVFLAAIKNYKKLFRGVKKRAAENIGPAPRALRGCAEGAPTSTLSPGGAPRSSQ